MKTLTPKGRFARRLKFVAGWSSLRRIQQVRVLQRAYVWLIIVPLLAKALEWVPARMDVRVFGADFTISPRLPFSWAVFFFCALCLTIANILFQIRCPALVREHVDYEAFKRAGRGEEQLRRTVVDPEVNGASGINLSVLDMSRPVLDRFQARIEQGSRSVPEMEPEVARLSEGELKEVFWGIFGALDRGLPRSRWTCASFYAAAFVLLLCLLCQNVGFVLRHLPSSAANGSEQRSAPLGPPAL